MAPGPISVNYKPIYIWLIFIIDTVCKTLMRAWSDGEGVFRKILKKAVQIGRQYIQSRNNVRGKLCLYFIEQVFHGIGIYMDRNPYMDVYGYIIKTPGRA